MPVSMVSVERLSQVGFFRGLPPWALRQFAEAAGEKQLATNEFVVHQHDEAHTVFFLLAGSVQFFIRFEGVDDLLVGTMNEVGGVVGWSSFRIPYRYTASVRCEQPCRVLKVPREAFSDVFEKDPRLGYTLLRRIAGTLANRLEQTRDILVAPGGCESAGMGSGL